MKPIQGTQGHRSCFNIKFNNKRIHYNIKSNDTELVLLNINSLKKPVGQRVTTNGAVKIIDILLKIKTVYMPTNI